MIHEPEYLNCTHAQLPDQHFVIPGVGSVCQECYDAWWHDEQVRDEAELSDATFSYEPDEIREEMES